jgi:hypothetical protein
MLGESTGCGPHPGVFQALILAQDARELTGIQWAVFAVCRAGFA